MAKHSQSLTPASTLQRAARWVATVLVDSSMVVMFIVITVPAVILGTASAIGTAAGLWLFAFGDHRGAPLGGISFAVLAACFGLLAAQDRLLSRSFQENGEAQCTLAKI